MQLKKRVIKILLVLEQTGYQNVGRGGEMLNIAPLRDSENSCSLLSDMFGKLFKEIMWSVAYLYAGTIRTRLQQRTSMGSNFKKGLQMIVPINNVK